MGLFIFVHIHGEQNSIAYGPEYPNKITANMLIHNIIYMINA